MKALITAGGTSEPIDDVRVVTNLSKGRFGASIANALVARGVDVVLLASRSLMEHPDWVDPRVERVPYGSFAELDAALAAHTATPPDLLFMAAAVSDYSPIPADGKIRSTSDELVIRMQKNPKLLATLRERCGRATFLVGFKLLSGVSPDELVSVARRQIRTARLDLTVANDLQTFRPSLHPVVLVTPEGGAIPHEGTKDDVARVLVDFCLARAGSRWCHTVQAAPVASLDAEHAVAAGLLGFAQRAGLLTAGPDGNVSARAPGGLWATPRQIDKGSLGADALVRVHADLDGGTHRFDGPHKPSIDATVAAWLYRALPGLAGLVHTHDVLAIPTAETAFPWPCGSLDEAEEIHRALTSAALAGADTTRFCLRLVDHGWLIGTADPAGLIARWDALVSAHDAHLAPLGGVVHGRQPVFDGGRIVGVWAELGAADRTAYSLWLAPDARGGGRGDRLARLVGDRDCEVVVDDRCGARDFWVARGFREVAREGTRTVLASPARHGQAIPAASVCLVNPVTRQVLLGERTTGAYPGMWSFPGGRVEPGETEAEAGDRELLEETGVRRPAVPLWFTTAIHVGDGQRVWRVLNHAYITLDMPDPSVSDELSARWVGLDHALASLPTASGTTTVLRAVADRLS